MFRLKRQCRLKITDLEIDSLDQYNQDTLTTQPREAPVPFILDYRISHIVVLYEK